MRSISNLQDKIHPLGTSKPFHKLTAIALTHNGPAQN